MSATCIDHAFLRRNRTANDGVDRLYGVYSVNESGKLVYWGEGLLTHPRATHRRMIDGFDKLPPDEAAERADDLDFWFNREGALELIEYLHGTGCSQVTLVPVQSEQVSVKLTDLLRTVGCTECDELRFHTDWHSPNQAIAFHTDIDPGDWFHSGTEGSIVRALQ